MHSSMKLALLAAAGVLPGALAHYNFEALIVNGETTGPYEFVRRTTNANSPIEDVTSPNIACNQGGSDPEIMAATDTMTVQAGDQLGFTVNSELGHPGPQAVYLSKAPGAASEYAGDGDWFKIYELTYSEINEQGIQWATFPNNAGVKNFTFTLPAEVPSGEYLLRTEHVGLHGAGTVGGAQFYIGCAQINIEGGGSGTPGPTVKFPGAYDGTEPGLHINIYYPPPTEYIMFGPAPWPNACADHTANLDGQESDGDCTGDDGSSAPEQPPSTPTTPGAPEQTVVPTPAPTTLIPTPVPTPTTTPTPVLEPEEPVEEEPDTECPARRRRIRRSRRSSPVNINARKHRRS